MSSNAAIANDALQTTLGRAGLLRTFGFFKDCPDDFYLALAMITEVRTAGAEEALLKEGQINDSIYFLISGAVEVAVQGERVATLEKPGDILGEMSVITARPASATLIAKTPIVFFAIPASKLEELTRSSRSFGYHIFRTYSLALSEKIVFTNDKARRFEMANRALSAAIAALEVANNELESKVQERTRALLQKTEELEKSYMALETQNTALVASHRKLEELYSSKDHTFKRLTDLYSNHLEPLYGALAEDPVNQSAETQSHIQSRFEKTRSFLSSSLEMLRPMTELYSTEQAIRSKRVLLAESDRKQQVIAKLALGGTGVNLDIVTSVEEGLERFNASGIKYDLAFISPTLCELGAQVVKRYPAAKLVFMPSSEIPSYLSILRENPIFNNIVSRDVDDRTFTVKNIVTTVSKLLSRDLFGLEKYLIWGVEVHSHPVQSSDQRGFLLMQFQDQLKKVGVRNSIIERAHTVAEEMLMNAIYDAPMAPDGTALYNHLPRTQSVMLEPKHYGEFRYACDGMLAAVSVSDPFGGFRSEILMSYLEKNYAGVAEVNPSHKGGAGRGLHQIIQNSDLVVFNVRPNVRTEAIALFNLDPQAASEESKPAFHFFID